MFRLNIHHHKEISRFFSDLLRLLFRHRPGVVSCESAVGRMVFVIIYLQSAKLYAILEVEHIRGKLH